MLVSASALVRNCGFARVLNRQRPKSANAQVACDRGTIFHQAVETWLLTGEVPVLADLEIQGWLDLLVSDLLPRVDMETEVAWGLSAAGTYLDVVEPEPHVYRPAMESWELLTAGRADLVWERSGVINVVDWKTGKYPATPAADNLQVNSAGIALAARTVARAYRPIVYYARDGFWDGRDAAPVMIGSPEYERIFAEIKTAALLDETPRPGDHCGKCWERKGCSSAADVTSQ